MGSAEQLHNLLAEGWGILTGQSNIPIYANEQPGTPVDVGNPLWTLLEGLVAQSRSNGTSLSEIKNMLANLPSSGGLSDADRASIDALT
jgi:hypothetical protein